METSTTSISRKSGIPKPIHRLSSMESSFSTSNGNLLRLSMSPSPTEELSKSRFNLNSNNSISNISIRSTDSSSKIVDLETKIQKMADENHKLRSEMQTMRHLMGDLQRKYEKEQSTRDTFETIQFEQKKTIKTLQNNLDRQITEFRSLVDKNAKFRKRLFEVLPQDENLLRDSSLILEMPQNNIKKDPTREDSDEDMIDEVEKMKNYINRLELQIYEMNEKVSDLIENTQQLDRENKKLKVENENMNSLAKLVTDNMKDSIDTSRRLEDEIRQMKFENESLIRQRNHSNRSSSSGDSTISNGQTNILPTPPPIAKKPDIVPTKRITEMHENELTLVQDSDLGRTVELLEFKLELVEEELSVAVFRAEKAELELSELKRASRLALATASMKRASADANQPSIIPSPPPPPPPPPPPLPKVDLIKLAGKNSIRLTDGCDGDDGGTGNMFSQSGLKKTTTTTNPGQATGMDALISELKHGQVTLRRRKRPDQQAANPALKELFAVLEASQKQNRTSKTFLINHKLNIPPTSTTSPDSEESLIF